MKTIFASLAFFLSSAAATTCYQIFSPSNALVWQANQPPVEMDHPLLDDEVNRLVPGGHLIVVDGRMPCRVLDLTKEASGEEDWRKRPLAPK